MADGAVVRTVGELMSSPVVTAEPAETVAAASTRMRDAGVGSVVVVDGTRRAVGILTERDLVRFAAAGDDAAGHQGLRVDDRGPGHGRARRPGRRGLRRGCPSTATATSRSSTTRRRSSASCRCGTCCKIAAIEPVTHPGHIEAPKGLAGVIVAETAVGDVRGQEGFYHYRQYSATDLAEKRSLEDVWHLMFEGELPTAAAAGGLRRARSGPTGSCPTRSPPSCRPSPTPASASCRSTACARSISLRRLGAATSSRRSTSTRRGAARATPCRSAP